MDNQNKKFLLSSLFAGAMIGVGCMVFLSCESKALGAFLFSAGLFFVLTYGGTLFTGVCGLKTPWKRLIMVFLLNGVGILAAGMLTWTGSLPEAAAAVMRKKLAAAPLSWLTNGILCGAMMYLGVIGFKRAKEGVLGVASVLYAVPVFILAAFEHSIADMGYLFIAVPKLNISEVLLAVPTIAVIAIGNVIGAKAIRFLTEGE